MIISTEENFIQPQIQSVSKGDEVLYNLTDDYTFEWKEKDDKGTLQIYRRTVFKLNYTTDLASTPDFASTLGFRKSGTSDGGAAVHDENYKYFGEFKIKQFPSGAFLVFNETTQGWDDAEPKYWTRMRCDKLYKRMCLAGGMTPWRANVEFLALRAGAISYKNGLKWYFS